MTEKDDPMAFMDFTVEEAVRVAEQMRTRPSTRDGRICLCGHSAGRHQLVAGYNSCKPSAMECACKTFRAVIDVSDTRAFLRKTEGSGAMHAFGRGLGVALSKGIKVEWIIPLECDRCRATDAKLMPVPVTQTGIAVTRDTGFNALLCATCRVEV